MSQGLKDLFSSERGTFAMLAIVAVTVLVIVGKLTGQQWLDFVKWIAMALIASKAVTTAVATHAGTPVAPDGGVR